MAGDEQLVRIGGRRLRITNLEKVLYPETATTKGEVIDYYSRIGPLLIPHVIGRPVTRKRWPEGVDHPDFFAKDLERGAPSWVKRMPIPHSTGTKDYPLVGDVPTLVYLAQVASLELHVPQWRFTPDGDRGFADRLVLDLDPGPGVGLAECAIVAGWARAILEGMGLDPYPVTSGSKGIHLYAALPHGYTTEQASAVAKELARAIEADHPDLVVSEMAKAARSGRVFIDWSQNNGSKTTIAPYSLRGRAHPTVAAPRTWEELEDPALRHLLFDEVLERAETMGDPMGALGYHAGGRESSDGPLAAYIAKRTAGRTPEPVPSNALGAASASDDLPRFVIQEHHASRLHWDLRLERDGVLVSWAVPRGIPPSSTRNNLAVMTEDHPMEYVSFEGTIPRGEYGAGTMTIWDDGRYELEKWRDGDKDGEIIFTAEGRPGGPLGRVRLALIRTSGRGEKSQWLLHRMKTVPTPPPPAAGASGGASGRVGPAAGHPQPEGSPVEASEQADPPPAASADAAEMRSSAPDRPPAHTPPPADEPPPAAPAAPASPVAAEPAPMPTRAELTPMLANPATPGLARAAARDWAASSAHGEEWVEMKWDGVRAVGFWDGRRLHLRARSGNDITAKYPELTRVDLGFGTEPAVIDGEIVALDSRGRPSFPRLQNRMNLAKPREIEREVRRTPVHYYVFDVLSHGSLDAAALPLAERRGILESLTRDAVAPVVVPPVFHDVDLALAQSRRFGLEGVVVKNPASAYRRGLRSDDWLKVKLTRTQEVVIGAIRPGKGGRSGTIGSLLVGIPDAETGVIQYAGRVGSGFSDATLAKLEELLRPLRTADNPFAGVPALDARDALWVRPEVVGEVEFAEFTPGGILRQSRWRGLRPDKSPADVRLEPPTAE